MQVMWFGVPVGAAGDASQEETLAQVEALFTQAAQRAVAAGVAPEVFVAAAHAAYLNASPELRDRLESAQLLAHVAELRRRGLVAEA